MGLRGLLVGLVVGALAFAAAFVYRHFPSEESPILAVRPYITAVELQERLERARGEELPLPELFWVPHLLQHWKPRGGGGESYIALWNLYESAWVEDLDRWALREKGELPSTRMSTRLRPALYEPRSRLLPEQMDVREARESLQGGITLSMKALYLPVYRVREGRVISWYSGLNGREIRAPQRI